MPLVVIAHEQRNAALLLCTCAAEKKGTLKRFTAVTAVDVDDAALCRGNALSVPDCVEENVHRAEKGDGEGQQPAGAQRAPPHRGQPAGVNCRAAAAVDEHGEPCPDGLLNRRGENGIVKEKRELQRRLSPAQKPQQSQQCDYSGTQPPSPPVLTLLQCKQPS